MTTKVFKVTVCQRFQAIISPPIGHLQRVILHFSITWCHFRCGNCCYCWTCRGNVDIICYIAEKSGVAKPESDMLTLLPKMLSGKISSVSVTIMFKFQIKSKWMFLFRRVIVVKVFVSTLLLYIYYTLLYYWVSIKFWGIKLNTLKQSPNMLALFLWNIEQVQKIRKFTLTKQSQYYLHSKNSLTHYHHKLCDEIRYHNNEVAVICFGSIANDFSLCDSTDSWQNFTSIVMFI